VLVNAHGFEELENILRGVDYRKLAPYLFEGIMSGDNEHLWFLHGCMVSIVVFGHRSFSPSFLAIARDHDWRHVGACAQNPPEQIGRKTPVCENGKSRT
jgi:hypothetical protein